MSEKIDYAAVIAALEAERDDAVARFNAAIDTIRQLAARPVGSGSEQLALVGNGEQPTRPYAGMSVTKAAAAFLRAVGKPRSTGEISRALDRGGIAHKSKSFPNTVYSRLYLDKGFVRERDKWMLREWKEKQSA